MCYALHVMTFAHIQITIIFYVWDFSFSPLTSSSSWICFYFICFEMLGQKKKTQQECLKDAQKKPVNFKPIYGTNKEGFCLESVICKSSLCVPWSMYNDEY